MISRRAFLKGLTATAAGLLVPSGLITDAEEVRRFWALGPMPQSEPMFRAGDQLQVRLIGSEFWSAWGEEDGLPFVDYQHHVKTVVDTDYVNLLWSVAR